MTLDAAIQIRQDQLEGKPVHKFLLDEAMAVIAASVPKRRHAAYGTTVKSRRVTDNKQVRLLKAELEGRK